MRTLAATLLLIGLCACKQEQKLVKNDLQQKHLKGKVSSVVEEDGIGTEQMGEIKKGDAYLSTETRYDEFGNKMQEVIVQDAQQAPGGFVKRRFDYKYDEKHRLSEKIYFSDTMVIWRVAFEYDPTGTEMRWSKYWGKYAQREALTIQMYSEALQYTDVNRNINEYGARHSDMDLSRYSDGKLESKGVIKLDANGNETEIATYSPEGQLLKKTVKRYDHAGNELARVNYEYVPMESVDSTTSAYDEKSNLVNLMSVYRGFVYQHTSRYDEHGSVLCCVHTSPSKVDSSRCAYQYDKAGNWINQITTDYTSGEGGEVHKAYTVAERTIDYF